MADNDDRRREHRSIIERVIVRGELVLQSPAHFGGAEADALTDMPVLLDEVDSQPLLPGTSIAGALRNYLREVQVGNGVKIPKKNIDTEDAFKTERERAATLLFGGFRGDDEGEQSPLVVEDAIGSLSDFELRDGVSIEAETRTAKDSQKFDIQLLGAGTSFPLQFELAITEPPESMHLSYEKYRAKLLNALATALKGFEESAITLGLRKRRGFGKCHVAGWEVTFYNLKDKQGLLDWLSSDRGWVERPKPSLKPIKESLSAKELIKDERKRATLKATFGIDGTLLIRSGFGDLGARADTVHLHATRKKGTDISNTPVIPGTSWAGILRHRALKIARTLSDDKPKLDKDKKPVVDKNGKLVPEVQDFIDGMFGPSVIEEKSEEKFNKEREPVKASRISIEESEVKQAESLEITRVAIDRFTGGAYEGALFTEQPLVGAKDSEVELVLTLRSPDDPEIGLLLLLLKDLWTGDLPIGGESGVGRGRLRGKHANLTYGSGNWEIIGNEDGSLQLPANTQRLEDFVDAFNKKMGVVK